MMTDALLKDLQNRLGTDLMAFLPALVISGAIVLLLLLRMLPGRACRSSSLIALMFSLLGLGTSLSQWYPFARIDPRTGSEVAIPLRPLEIFGGMLVFDNFSIFLNIFLFVFLAAVVLLTMLTRIPDAEDSADFYTLLFGATLGMMLMGAANHLLMVFLAIEMASLPSYALAGFLKGKRPSSEAALKYVVYGGGAAGVMLYGISLIAGKFGTAYMPDVLRFVAGSLGTDPQLIVILGLLFIFIGLAFKLSAVPFHFWAPDVFEGAGAEVGAFLSIASKAAALALLARFTMPLASHPEIIVPTLAFIATLTTTFGNLAAYSQTNLKRLLAYSTIAHAGFMIMGLATLTHQGAEAVLFYLVTYLFMNLGAFAVVAFLRNATGSEDLRQYRGLVQRSPVLVCTLGVFLLSLVGLPPFAGFAGKFQIFSALFDGAKATTSPIVRYSLYALVLVGGLNTVISLFYYLKVLKVMVLDKPLEEIEGQPVPAISVGPGQTAYVVVLATIIVVLGIQWNQLTDAAQQAVMNFPSIPAAAPVQAAAPEGHH